MKYFPWYPNMVPFSYVRIISLHKRKLKKGGEIMKDNPKVMAPALQVFASEVFEGAGLPPVDAALEAEVLVWANLRGIDSHGVLRIPAYLEWIASGDMNPHPEPRLLHETPAILHMDADGALGPVATVPAMRRVIDKARVVGIGWGVLSNITHQGAMGYYAQLAAEAGMAGIAITCSRPNMAPFGARAAGVHNSPIAIAVPAQNHPPVILDMATSVAAGGKLSVAIDKRVSIPKDWALDEKGNPTTDPKKARTLQPFGGPKGSGLAFMFECLTSIMANNPLVVPTLQDEKLIHNQNSIVAAIDISIFSELDSFEKNVTSLITELKDLPMAEGHDEIFSPGEPEDKTFNYRIENGIPLPPGTVKKLRDTSKMFDIELPSGL